jgi:cation transport ATPase
MKKLKSNFRSNAVSRIRHLLTTLILIILCLPLYAQDGNAGISEATTQVKSYFATGTSLMYAIGALVGLVGAIKVYKKFNDGEHDTGKVASSWFGSCIFLVIVATVLKSFFGV